MFLRSLIHLVPTLGFLAVAAALPWRLDPERKPREAPIVRRPHFLLSCSKATSCP